MLPALATLFRPPGPAAGACAGAVDIHTLIAASVQHDVAPLVATRMLAGEAGPLDALVAEGLEIFLEGTRLAAAQQADQLADLLAALHRHGIAAADIPATLDCLLETGFTHEAGFGPRQIAALRRYAGEFILFHPTRLPVEPYWLVAPRTLAFDLDMPAMLARAAPGAFDGAPCHLLRPDDHLLLLALHGAKEQWHRLKWVADIAAHMAAHPDTGWAGLRATAAAQGCARMLDLALLLVHRVFGVTLPADVRPDAATHAPAGIPYVRDGVYWRMRERTRDRLAYAARTVFTPRVAHISRLVLPDWLSWAYWPLKLPWDLLLTPALAAWRGRSGRGGHARRDHRP